MKKLQSFLLLTIVLVIGCKEDEDIKPAVKTLAASELTQTTATLNGVVNANGLTSSIIFEYGTTTEYGQTIIPSLNQINGKTETNVSVDIYGLTPNTIYHYRIVASSSAGISKGSDLTFSTLEQLTWVKVGISSPEILIKDIVPDTVITAPWSWDANYNIDINSDYIDDINLRVHAYYLGGGLVLADAGVNIKTLNNETFVLTDSIYPYALSYDDSIKIIDKWGADNLTLESFIQSYPPIGPGVHEGYWYGINNKYVGIKYNNRLGWIKLDTYTTSFKVYEYALQK
jgi:hypothetical protein